ncbi:helix-turn-helix domain-containing protein [Epilithonimonas sp. JDS]|uniref:helix-turn-helix domain-containing protein n=1 Tax=Epilithonimonas sp. JDS TaxID=2902797 RepID=UPI001E44FFD1|nr:helix-turn-helix domain-containing protein [Epilithonimonas sp. JDS]
MADYVLAIWFMIIGIHLIFFMLLWSETYLKFPYLLGIEIPFPLIHGPMLYLYVLCLTGSAPKRHIWLFHIAPVFSIYLILINFFLLPSQDKINIYQQGGGAYKMLRIYIKVLIVISGIVYVGMSISAIRKYRNKISGLYSNTEKINLNWVYYLIAGIALIWFAVILKNDLLIFSLVTVFIIVAAYFGISRVGILDHQIQESAEVTEDPIGTSPLPNSKYEKNFAGEETIQNIHTRLVALMDVDKIYKNPELNLNSVAKLLDVHPNTLSQTINSIENKNFYDFINSRRIEEFKRIALLSGNAKYTILSLALESGFNSKTSFNRNFKKFMHSSPREFLKSHKVDME